MQRGRQSGDPPAHHAEVGGHVAVKARERRGERQFLAVPDIWPDAFVPVRVQPAHTLSSRCSRSHGEITCRKAPYSSRLTEE